MNIEFVDDFTPGKNSKNSAQVQFADTLRQNPNRWAKYPFPIKAPSTYACHIRNGRIKCFARGFEAATRDGELHVRYVGSDIA